MGVMTVYPNSRKQDKRKVSEDKHQDSRITTKIDEKWNIPKTDKLGPKGKGVNGSPT